MMFFMKKIGRPLVDKCNIFCPICNKEFFVHPYRLKRTKKICCSSTCKYKLIQLNRKITKNCIICNKEFSFKKSYNPNKANVYCSHECMFKGKITSEISLYREKAFAHFEHICYFCKSDKKLEVHHKDHNRSNNDISNLVILCKSCHKKLHLISLHSALTS